MGVEVAPMQGETILYDPAGKSFCVLNPTAAYLWEQLAQPRDADELAAALRDGFATATADDLPRDVQSSLDTFVSLDLVTRAPDA